MIKFLLVTGMSVCLLSSCATLLNGRKATIDVHTTRPSTITVGVFEYNVQKKVTIAVPRSKEPLVIKVVADSLEKEVSVKAKTSFAVYANLLFNYGLGLLVDLKNPKRYTYPRHVYLDILDTTTQYLAFPQKYKKGDLYLQLSVPYTNIFQLRPQGEPATNNLSFFGISAGVDYYYQKKQFINITGTLISSVPIPFPAPFDFSGEYDRVHSSYLSVSNNHHIHRFTVGYGLSYSYDTWRHGYSSRFNALPPVREPVKKSHPSAGLLTSVYYHTGPRFKVGVVYRPSLYSFGDVDAFQYQHLISIDLGWKLKLR
jgi:hypothetical protein